MRVAELHQAGAFCMLGKVALERNLAHLIGFSAGWPHCNLLGCQLPSKDRAAYLQRKTMPQRREPHAW
jgi:hypothetical protein